MANSRRFKRPYVEDPVLAKALQQIDDEFSNLFQAVAGAGGGAVPTGTGFRHVVAGVEDAAAKLVENADVAVAAGIVESKLALNNATHSAANDPTADQKAALAGTSGIPSVSNKYVTDADARNTNARTPSAHSHAESEITNLVTDLGNKEVTANKGAASGYASLNGSTKVVEDPANATATPTASKIPIADASGNLDGWQNSVLDDSSSQRVFMSCLAPGGAGFLLISGTGYWVYLGRTKRAITPTRVEFHVSTIGAGAQTAEVGFFSTPAAPNKAAQSVTKLVSTGTVDALTSTGVKRNTAAFATSIPAGTHLWAGIRTAMATTQPTIWGIGVDMAQGQILVKTSAGVLTGTGPWAGVIVAAATGMVCPDLRGTMD